ncbi:MAG: hypothetical protein JSV36_13025 [Anaerolineae bacterium]|nr:MAG: hypothetical protein JSV36_13025 [Anaerolineae bacterium]
MSLKTGLDKLKQFVAGILSRRSRPSDDSLDLEMLKGMVQEILSTRPDEIGCAECFEQLDRFVEIVLAGKNAAEAMPLVQDHLNRCADCRQEFEALLAALRAMA